jgi:hypothetical protein
VLGATCWWHKGTKHCQVLDKNSTPNTTHKIHTTRKAKGVLLLSDQQGPHWHTGRVKQQCWCQQQQQQRWPWASEVERLTVSNVHASVSTTC